MGSEFLGMPDEIEPAFVVLSDDVTHAHHACRRSPRCSTAPACYSSYARGVYLGCTQRHAATWVARGAVGSSSVCTRIESVLTGAQ